MTSPSAPVRLRSVRPGPAGRHAVSAGALGALLVAAAAACAGTRAAPSASSAHPPAGEVLFAHGRIHLGGDAERAVDALLARDGRVVAAGAFGELRAAAPGARVVDLGGGVAVPGLQDAHGHLEGLGAALESVDLVGTASYGEVVDRVAARAAELPAGAWIEGRGWDQNDWEDTAFPTHAALSARVPDHPVLVRRIDGHAALVNAAALRLAGLDGVLDPAPAVAGGRVVIDGEGRATGVLVDAAMDLVGRHVPPPDRAARRRRILRAQDELLAVGLTCVHDMGASPSTVDLLEELRDEGLLKLRLVEYLAGAPALDAMRPGRFPLAPDPAGRLAVPGVKLYADGALGSRGAALLEDYADEPGNRGLLQTSPEELHALVERCARLGLQPAVHAIGDRGNRLVLDVFDRVAAEHPGFRALRPRIEHAQIVDADDWVRFRAGGYVPSVQPTHATSDMPWVPARLGAQRLAGAYPWRRLAPDTAALALGSDFPVERPDPLEGLHAARTRQDRAGRPPGGWLPDQRLDAREALAGFTAGAARAAHQEESRGRLAPGYCADLTVLDVDPLACAPRELLDARVLMTVIDGEVVYRAGP